MKFKEMPFSKKFEHIWEYYRYHIIGSIFVLFMVGSWGYSIITHVSPDVQISVVATDPDIQVQLENKLMEKFASSMPDFNQDKKKKISVVNMMPFSEQTPPDQLMAVQQKFFAELAAGENDLYIVDEVYLEMLKRNEVALPLDKTVDVNKYPQVVAKEGEFAGKVVAVPLEQNPLVKNSKTYYMVIKRPNNSQEKKPMTKEKIAYLPKVIDAISTNFVN